MVFSEVFLGELNFQPRKQTEKKILQIKINENVQRNTSNYSGLKHKPGRVIKYKAEEYS